MLLVGLCCMCVYERVFLLFLNLCFKSNRHAAFFSAGDYCSIFPLFLTVNLLDIT